MDGDVNPAWNISVWDFACLVNWNLLLWFLLCFYFGKLLSECDFHYWKILSKRKGCVTLQGFCFERFTSTNLDFLNNFINR